MHLICWNRVEDIDRWLEIFTSHKTAHREAGLFLSDLWVQDDDPSVIHYLFEVRDRERAEAFMDAPDAGVIEGSCHFVESRRSDY